MNAADREEVMETLFERIRNVMTVKGADYSRGEEDVNSNFKRVGDALGLKPQEVAWVYTLKHVDSISAYLKNGTASEPIEDRIMDVMAYQVILYSILLEAAREEKRGGAPG